MRLRVRARELAAAGAAPLTVAEQPPSPAVVPRGGASEGGSRSVHRQVASDQLVTPAKRRRIAAAQRAALREDAVALRQANSAAWRTLARNLQPVGESDDEGVVPLPVHDSHECLVCGGFVGCIRCGAVISAQLRSALSVQCRGFCPDNACGPVRRLALGRLPRGDRWPSGEAEPLPKRLRR